jgi:hypothetical protein
MNTVKKTLICLAVSSAALGGAAATAAPAFAGSNGQQVEFCAGPRSSGGFAWARGINQNGDVKGSPDVKVGPRGSCKLLANWWWKGEFAVHWTNEKRGLLNYTVTYRIPVKMRGNVEKVIGP